MKSCTHLLMEWNDFISLCAAAAAETEILCLTWLLKNCATTPP